MPNQMHIPHILSITLLYVDPPNLPNFFLHHNINLNTKFSYKNIYNMLPIDIYTIFPSITLLSASIVSSNTPNPNFLKKITSQLTHLHFPYNTALYIVTYMPNCPNLQSITTSIHIPYIFRIITSAPKLHSLSIQHSHLENNAMKILSSCINLINLELGSFNLKHICCFNTLITLKFGSFALTNTMTNKLSTLLHCPNLRHITFINYQNINDISHLHTFTNLHSIKFIRCLNLRNISSTYNLKKLRSIKIIQCPNLFLSQDYNKFNPKFRITKIE